jgi:hypothetical protein
MGLRNWKSGQGPKGCRAIERERERIDGDEWSPSLTGALLSGKEHPVPTAWEAG